MRKYGLVGTTIFAILVFNCFFCLTRSNAQTLSLKEARLVALLCSNDGGREQSLDFEAHLVNAAQQRIGLQHSSESLLFPDDAYIIVESIYEKESSFSSYADCFLRVFSALEPRRPLPSEPSSEPDGREGSESRIADIVLPDPVALESSGHPFPIEEGDFRGLIHSGQIFTVLNISDGYIDYRFSDIQSGVELASYAYENSLIDVTSECRLRVYSINNDSQVPYASFQLYCDN